MSPTTQMGQYDCKRCCPAHLLHPTQREHRPRHRGQDQPLVPVHISLPWHEMLPQLPQDPPSQAASPPPHVHAFSNRVSFFTKCSLHSSNYMTRLWWSEPSTGMCAPVWGSEEGSGREFRVSYPLKVKHGSDKPWKAVVLKSAGGMQNIQGLCAKENSLTGWWLPLRH